MGSDAPPQHFEPPKGFSVSLQIKDPAAGERIFNALADQGTVKMPFQQTFWAAPLRNAGRPIRYSVDDQLREGRIETVSDRGFTSTRSCGRR